MTTPRTTRSSSTRGGTRRAALLRGIVDESGQELGSRSKDYRKAASLRATADEVGYEHGDAKSTDIGAPHKSSATTTRGTKKAVASRGTVDMGGQELGDKSVDSRRVHNSSSTRGARKATTSSRGVAEDVEKDPGIVSTDSNAVHSSSRTTRGAKKAAASSTKSADSNAVHSSSSPTRSCPTRAAKEVAAGEEDGPDLGTIPADSTAAHISSSTARGAKKAIASSPGEAEEVGQDLGTKSTDSNAVHSSSITGRETKKSTASMRGTVGEVGKELEAQSSDSYAVHRSSSTTTREAKKATASMRGTVDEVGKAVDSNVAHNGLVNVAGCFDSSQNEESIEPIPREENTGGDEEDDDEDWPSNTLRRRKTRSNKQVTRKRPRQWLDDKIKLKVIAGGKVFENGDDSNSEISAENEDNFQRNVVLGNDIFSVRSNGTEEFVGGEDENTTDQDYGENSDDNFDQSEPAGGAMAVATTRRKAAIVKKKAVAKKQKGNDRKNQAKVGPSKGNRKNVDDSYCSEESSEFGDNDSIDETECRPRILKRGQYLRDLLEFSVEPIRHLFVCPLCNGLYREPYSITKQCLHTFCKSCLVLAIASQENEQQGSGGYCPKCFDYLGIDWRKHIMPDRSLERLMDKVLLVDMAAADEDEETAFYRRRGIKRKPEKSYDKQNKIGEVGKFPIGPMDSFPNKSNEENENSKVDSKPEAKPDSVLARIEHIRLVPATGPPAATAFYSSMGHSKSGATVVVDDTSSPPPPPPPLDKPFLEVPGNIRIGVLKKYLAMKVPSLLCGEISCNGSALGNEWTIGFIKRTIWMSTDDSSVMTLEFR